MTTQPMAAALAEAAATAGRAPSVHNTQPWRWRVTGDTLDLYADRGRQLTTADPLGRLLTTSCGCALHHARVALAAQGWAASVEAFPDPQDADHLARVTLTGRTPVTPQAMRLVQTIAFRHTDRRPVVDVSVSDEAFEMLRRTASQLHTGLHPLRPDEVAELASAAAAANEIGLEDADQRAEMAYWVGGARPEGTGVPETAVPSHAPRTGVPGRDFGHPGTLAVGAGHDRLATYAILFGRGDEPADWLRAGEALSAVWLLATELGLAVLPLSSVVEVAVTWERLRRILSHLDYPYIVLRLGRANPDEAGAPLTPRLAAGQTIERSPGP